MKKQVSILFIVKQRNCYGSKSKSYGLVNSCKFIAQELKNYNICANVVEVVDNNDIDRMVSIYNPTYCIIEALWVVPSKFKILAKLHPRTHWIVRIHSKIPFLATEGISMQWISEYLNLSNLGIKISVAANNKECVEELNTVFNTTEIIYLPNVYFSPKYIPQKHISNSQELNIGCFGALRPLKNTLQQAVWAIQFAEKKKKHLNFHINYSDHEKGIIDPIFKNVKNLFNKSSHKLIIHDWVEHEDFLKVVSQMDLGMQISFTETFNIVAADFVHCNIPIVVSEEIEWVFPTYRVDASNTNNVLEKMDLALNGKAFDIQWLNKTYLKNYNVRSLNIWLSYLNHR